MKSLTELHSNCSVKSAKGGVGKGARDRERSQHYQWLQLLPKQGAGAITAYVYNIPTRAVSEGNRGRDNETINIYAFKLKGQTAWIWEQEAVCSRTHMSELHPLTASRSDSEGLTQDERAGMRKWLKAQIYSLCCLPDSTVSLSLIWEPLG